MQTAPRRRRARIRVDEDSAAPPRFYEDHLPAMMLAQVLYQTQTVQTGIGIGAALAIVCSWQRNRSILWAILAGILSWFYVIYFALTRRPDEQK